MLLRYAPGQNPNGSLDDIAGVCNEQRNVFGLMPHPEHAVDPLTGLDRRAGDLRVDPRPRRRRRRASCDVQPAPVTATAAPPPTASSASPTPSTS